MKEGVVVVIGAVLAIAALLIIHTYIMCSSLVKVLKPPSRYTEAAKEEPDMRNDCENLGEDSNELALRDSSPSKRGAGPLTSKPKRALLEQPLQTCADDCQAVDSKLKQAMEEVAAASAAMKKAQKRATKIIMAQTAKQETKGSSKIQVTPRAASRVAHPFASTSAHPGPHPSHCV